MSREQRQVMRSAINRLAEQVHTTAFDHGWWPEKTSASQPVALPPERIAACLALIHSEVSEALEELRRGVPTACGSSEGGKPEGFGVEIADTIIRCLDLTEALGIDIGERILEKHEYNGTRPHRHGGKKL